ncbi:MAG: MmcQ/YjbR family DNA-binding protein [Candidatus Acidiferrales bacterium]
MLAAARSDRGSHVWASYISHCRKNVCRLEEYKGELGICVKVGTLMQGVFLDDSRFFRTPYIGKHGWVTLRVYAARLNESEIRELVKGSYQLVAPKSAGKKRSGRAR